MRGQATAEVVEFPAARSFKKQPDPNLREAGLADFQTIKDSGGTLVRFLLTWNHSKQKWNKDPAKEACGYSGSSDWWRGNSGLAVDAQGCTPEKAADWYASTPHEGAWGGVGIVPFTAGLIVLDGDFKDKKETDLSRKKQRKAMRAAVTKALGEPLVVLESVSGAQHFYYRLPKKAKADDPLWTNASWEWGDTRSAQGLLGVYDPAALAAALRDRSRKGAGRIDRGAFESILTSSPAAAAKAKQARVKRKKDRDAKNASSFASSERQEIVKIIFNAVRDGKESELDHDGLIARRAASSSEPEKADADLTRILKAALQKRADGLLKPWVGGCPTREQVETWCESGEYGCGLGEYDQPTLPMSEFGLDCALGLLGIKTRINTRAARRLEWSGDRAPDGPGGYGELRTDDSSWLAKECASKFREVRHTADQTPYEAPWRIPPTRLLEWIRACCRGDDTREVDPFLQRVDKTEWDGKERVDGWIRKVYVLHKDTDPALADEAGRLALMGAATRAVKPGAVADVVPVLQSREQGVYKSLGFASLFPEGAERDDWFIDQVPLAVRDPQKFFERLGAAVLGESSELAGLSRADVDLVKGLISARTHRFRPPYGRVPETFPMMAGLVGTTNRPDPLPDDTENRRWLVVQITGINDGALKWLDKNREQLWAEAVHRARGGELAILSDQLRKAQRKANRAFAPASSMTERLADLEPLVIKPLRLSDIRRKLADAEADKGGMSAEQAAAHVARVMDQFDKRGEMDLTAALTRRAWRKIRGRAGNLWEPPARRSKRSI